jgi:hypothetical protein
MQNPIAERVAAARALADTMRAAQPYYERAFGELEAPIDRLLSLARVQSRLLSGALPEVDTTSISQEDNAAMSFMGEEILRAASSLDEMWTRLHNRGTDAGGVQ